MRPPSEDASALLVEAETALGELESLIQRINRTNAATRLGEGTITDAIARRDVLRLRHGVLTAAADAAAGRNQGGYGVFPRLPAHSRRHSGVPDTLDPVEAWARLIDSVPR
ncbi:hypothetical protein [Amycolatopsis sp. NPDC102389]|uniref:DIP1984 family protein n=1 Tax=Amycolatopsis sp. NPDC102389 TaxID=3363941 RepID=UPI00382DD21E